MPLCKSTHTATSPAAVTVGCWSMAGPQSATTNCAQHHAALRPTHTATSPAAMTVDVHGWEVICASKRRGAHSALNAARAVMKHAKAMTRRFALCGQARTRSKQCVELTYVARNVIKHASHTCRFALCGQASTRSKQCTYCSCGETRKGHDLQVRSVWAGKHTHQTGADNGLQELL